MHPDMTELCPIKCFNLSLFIILGLSMFQAVCLSLSRSVLIIVRFYMNTIFPSFFLIKPNIGSCKFTRK